MLCARVARWPDRPAAARLGEAEQAAVAPEQLQDRLAVEEPVFSGWKRLLKGGIDCLGAVVAILLLAPALLGIAAAVRMSGPGPIVYRQVRVGARGRRYTMLKFRSSTTQTFACQSFNGSTRAMPPSFKLRRDPG